MIGFDNEAYMEKRCRFGNYFLKIGIYMSLVVYQLVFLPFGEQYES